VCGGRVDVVVARKVLIDVGFNLSMTRFNNKGKRDVARGNARRRMRFGVEVSGNEALPCYEAIDC
jgi:hypothetical protein